MVTTCLIGETNIFCEVREYPVCCTRDTDRKVFLSLHSCRRGYEGIVTRIVLVATEQSGGTARSTATVDRLSPPHVTK